MKASSSLVLLDEKKRRPWPPRTIQCLRVRQSSGTRGTAPGNNGRTVQLDRRTWPGQAAQRRMLDHDPRDRGRFDLSTFLSAPVSASETSTIGKPMKGYIETVGEGPVRTEKRVLVCRLKIVDVW